MEYLYGKLNKLVESQKYNFISSDGTLLVSNSLNSSGSNQINLTLNNQKLVKLLQVKKDLDPSDDTIKYYALYAYNPISDRFDIQLGDEIKIDTTSGNNGSGGIFPTINDIQIQIGEEDIFDEDGNKIGTVPKYAELKTSISEGGNLIISQIPASAITDTEYTFDEFGNPVTVQVQSNLDGNAGGEVY